MSTRPTLSKTAAPPTFTRVSEGNVRINRHLRSQYVPDAYGIQVLTDAHLSREASLTAWDVEEMAPERHPEPATSHRGPVTSPGPTCWPRPARTSAT